MARILIIEDNAPNLSLMSHLISAVGHDVEGCRDGHLGLERVRHGCPDVVLCDIQLPRLSGLDVARTLREDPRFRDLPVVAVTALAMPGDSEKAATAGFSGYIEKPIVPQTFALQVEAYLPPALRKGPAVAARQPAARPSVTAVPVNRNVTVLAVDDLADNLNLVQTLLQSEGIRVLTARSMHLGLEVLQREKVDLVVSDVHMLSGDGFRFRRAVLAQPSLRHIPFILVSSSDALDEDRLEAEQLGVFRLLERPLDPVRFNAAVAACLGADGRAG